MNDAVLEVGKMMGNSPEDIEKYGYRDPLSESEVHLSGGVRQLALGDAILSVAKMFGNSPEDIKKYGLVD